MGMGVLARQPARADMFRVAANMNETYYGEDVQQRKTNLDAPRVTINNHRMTNVQLPGGQVVQGIRRNNDLGYENQPPVAFESEQPMRPLRYTPGLKCDPALEAMRPERSMKHQALQGGDQWKKKLIQHPQTYEGSFADADMQQFRPYPNPNPMDDPWVQSRLPDQPMGGMQMQMQDAYAANDELTRIKMRNRRFQQSVAADQGLYGPPMPPAQLRGQPWMQQGPPMPPMQMETLPAAPIRPTRVNIDELLSTDSLPAPAKRGDAPKKEEAAPAPAPAPKQRQVGIADQIAIRSYVLGKGLAKSSMAE